MSNRGQTAPGISRYVSNVPNTLYYGDNLDSLRKHIRDETVDLCYIDPPFNSKRNYNQIYNNIGQEDRAQAQAFVDTWTWDDQASEGFQEITCNDQGRFSGQTVALIKGLRDVLKEGSLLAYLVSMTRRIVELHRVLKPTGSFYLHCDPTSSHYLKLVLDGIFCGAGGDFQNEIIWQRNTSHNSAKRYGRIHDTILFYSKSLKFAWNRQFMPYGEAQLSRYKKDDDGHLYRAENLTAERINSDSGKFAWRGTIPGATRGWAYTLEQLEQFWQQGRILNKRDGNPRMDGLKVFLDDSKGKPLQSIWTDIPPIGPAAAERLGYPTQKPEILMERIIRASSNEGDVILDAYCGCGTTVAVAQRLNRRWIGMDITYQSIALVLKRLHDSFGQDAADAVILNGAPKDMASATALANKKDDRVRKEFEKWAVLTYSGNRAAINQKKGADGGIDGTAYFLTGKTETEKMVLQVKSGHVGRGDIAKLKGDMQRENAVLATFITLEDSTGPMRSEAKMAGFYHHALMGRDYDKIEIVTIEDMLKNRRRLEMPLSLEVLRKGVQHNEGAEQLELAAS